MIVIPDVIVCYPNNCDYPLFRKYIHDERARFNQIHIVFTETNSDVNFTSFVQQAMFDDWTLNIIANPVSHGEDWRDKAIHQALMHSLHSEWILFIEQDFFMRDGFWDEVYQACNTNDVVAVYDNDRMHPCFILVKREILYKTRMNFGIVPNISDHFSMIQQDLESMEDVKIHKIKQSLYHHMNGLSSNFYLISQGKDPNYNPVEFQNYLKECLATPVLLHPKFVDIASDYLKRVGI